MNYIERIYIPIDVCDTLLDGHMPKTDWSQVREPDQAILKQYCEPTIQFSYEEVEELTQLIEISTPYTPTLWDKVKSVVIRGVWI